MLNAYSLSLETVENKFCGLKNDVRLVCFTRETDCPHGKETRKLLEHIASVTHKITFDVYNFAIDQEKDQEYGIFIVPAMAIIGEKDYGIRYYGCPKGAELTDFLDDIVYVSKGENTLRPKTAALLADLKKPARLKIFISPDCPYSLPVAKLALKLAIASDLITVEIIHADDFLAVAEKYKVRGIPMTIVNDQNSFYGALDEEEYINHILELT